MNISRLFRSYKYKLLWEGIFKSFLIALTASGATVFVISLIYHILAQKTPFVFTAWMAGGAFFAAFVLVFCIFYYPTKKRVAIRMDEMGLEERVGTMLEFQDKTGCMVQMQREDAILHIEKSSPRQLKLRSFWKEGILCAVCGCLAGAVLMVPYDVFEVVDKQEIVMEADQEQIIKDMIANMREEVKNSLLDDTLKEEIKEIIDKLEQDLNNTDSKLEQAGKIEDAKDQINDLIDKQLTRKSIGEELKKYSLTNPLGGALCDGNIEGVSQALDGLQEKAEEDHYIAGDLARIIDIALRDSEVAETDALYQAFAEFSKGLGDINPRGSTFQEELEAVFDAAEEAILKVLEKQAVIESEKEKIEDILNDAKEEILKEQEGKGEEGEEEKEGAGEEGEGEKGEEGKEGQEGEKGEGEGDTPGDQPGGDIPGTTPGEDGNGNMVGGGDGIGGNDEMGMTEGIFDPISGSVSYGKVFAAYYAEYLAARAEGKISKEQQEILDAYFASLTSTGR